MLEYFSSTKPIPKGKYHAIYRSLDVEERKAFFAYAPPAPAPDASAPTPALAVSAPTPATPAASSGHSVFEQVPYVLYSTYHALARTNACLITIGRRF